jgi:STE24 endopeptidase
MRRGIGGVAAVGLLLGIPWFLVSFAIVSQIASNVGGITGKVILFGWLLSGLAVFARPVEVFIARVLLRARRPTATELRQLDAPWAAVLTAAGIQRNTYSLWIQDTNELNAFAGAGHIVVVTRKALNTLQPSHLSAVLAHELGHHLKGDPWVQLLVQWYAAPAKIAVRIAAIVLGVVLRVAAAITFSSRIGFVLGVSMFLAIGIAVGVLLGPALLLLFLLAPLGAYFGRLDELQADKVAAKMGFGRQLIAVLQDCIHADHGDKRQKKSWRELALTTHPPLPRRIMALERHLQRERY